MRMIPLLSALVCGAWAASFAQAESPLEFDQGISAKEIVSELRLYRAGDGDDSLFRHTYGSIPLLEPVELPEYVGSRKVVSPKRLGPGGPKEILPCEQIDPDLDEGAAIALSETEKLQTIPFSERPTIIWNDRSEKSPVELFVRPADDSVTVPGAKGDSNEALPRDSEAYKESERWIARLPSLPIGRRPHFETWHQRIRESRAILMNSGRGHDRNEDRLAARLRVLQLWRSRISQRAALIDQDLNEFNRTCRDNPNPPSNCSAWEQRGNACIGRHNASIRRFNTAAGNWRKERDDHQTAVGVFREEVGRWEVEDVETFNQAFQKELAVTRTEVTNCRSKFRSGRSGKPSVCENTCRVRVFDLRTGQLLSDELVSFRDVVRSPEECMDAPDRTVCQDEEGNLVECP